MIKHRLEIQRNDEILIHAFKKRIIGIMGVDSCAMGVDAANKEYSHIIDYNSGATYVNPNPWSSHTLRIEKGKSRIDYWEE
jgi:hypothetical protein